MGVNATLERSGVAITNVVGTMWCAIAFTILALISAPAAFRSGDPIIIVAWVAQTFLQLVLLPIIMVGQKVTTAAADATTEAVDAHRAVTEAHTSHLEAIVNHLGIGK